MAIALVMLAVAVSGQVKPTLELIVAALIAPVAGVGLIAGWTKRGLRVFMALLVITAAAVAVLGEETRGRSLEEIAPEAEAA